MDLRKSAVTCARVASLTCLAHLYWKYVSAVSTSTSMTTMAGPATCFRVRADIASRQQEDSTATSRCFTASCVFAVEGSIDHQINWELPLPRPLNWPNFLSGYSDLIKMLRTASQPSASFPRSCSLRRHIYYSHETALR